jgi:predicted RNA-binding protein with PUA-like domain
MVELAMPNYWLVKSEPSTFSFDDLMKSPKRTTNWNGVRNFQARNHMQAMKKGDRVIFYHSSAEPPHVAGIAEVAREAFPDDTALDRKSDYFDPKATPDAPIWFMVDIKGVEKLKRTIPLGELRTMKGLEGMVLLKKGSRLSVQPVSEKEFETIYRAGMNG